MHARAVREWRHRLLLVTTGVEIMESDWLIGVFQWVLRSPRLSANTPSKAWLLAHWPPQLPITLHCSERAAFFSN